jgi:hypothetical protein
LSENGFSKAADGMAGLTMCMQSKRPSISMIYQACSRGIIASQNTIDSDWKYDIPSNYNKKVIKEILKEQISQF